MDKPGILIIDDDPSLRKTLADILTVKGYEALAAENGAGGLALMRERPFSLVLIDLGLPDLSGIEVLNGVKSARPATEAIILTGNATLDSAIEATNRGAFSYLVKPYDIDQLLLNIQRALEKQRAAERIVRHSTELERSNAELKIMYEISLAISRTIDLDRLLSDVLLAFAETRMFEIEMKGAIFLAEGDSFRLASAIGFSEADVETCRTVRRGDCLCGLALTTEEIMVSHNSEEDPLHARCIPETFPHGHVIVPLKAAETVVGLLDLYMPPEAAFDESTSRMLSAVGNQIGIAISNARLYEDTKSSSLHDPLTGLPNRRFMELQLEKVMESAKRYDRPLSVVMMDIDHFKRYNDTRGHVEGDRLLARVAEILLKVLRSADHVFRYGGEEFLAILPETDLAMAREAAERVRRGVAAEAGVTISLGVASYQKSADDKESLIGRADQALYRAKENGRNRVELFLPPEQAGVSFPAG